MQEIIHQDRNSHRVEQSPLLNIMGWDELNGDMATDVGWGGSGGVV